MSINQTSVIIKEYYNIISPLLIFEPCEKICEIEQQVLTMLCEAKGCGAIISECKKLIKSAECLEIASDGQIFFSEKS